jgi:hypothetical protein
LACVDAVLSCYDFSGNGIFCILDNHINI